MRESIIWNPVADRWVEYDSTNEDVNAKAAFLAARRPAVTVLIVSADEANRVCQPIGNHGDCRQFDVADITGRKPGEDPAIDWAEARRHGECLYLLHHSTGRREATR